MLCVTYNTLCVTYLTALVYVPPCVCTRNMNQVGASLGRCINSYSLINHFSLHVNFDYRFVPLLGDTHLIDICYTYARRNVDKSSNISTMYFYCIFILLFDMELINKLTQCHL